MTSGVPPSPEDAADSATDHDGDLTKLQTILMKRAIEAKEDEELVDLLMQKAAVLDDAPVKQAFLVKAYGKRLLLYRLHAKWWSFWRWIFTLVLASLGVVAAVAVPLANGNTKNIVALVAGALVTSLTAMYQALRPAVRSAQFDQTRSLLREEGWDYLLSLGRYKRLEPDAAYSVFAEQISGVIRRFTSSGEGPDKA